jgi:hypothetical protein
MTASADHLKESLHSMNRKRLAIFAICVATALGPFFSRFARSTPGGVFDDFLARLWEVVSSESPHEAQAILDSISTMPLAEEDDSNQPEFMAMRAMSTVDYAAQVWVHKRPAQAAIWAMNALQSIAQDMDYTLRDGSLLADVQKYQEDLIRSLSADSPKPGPCCSDALAARLSAAASDYGLKRGW